MLAILTTAAIWACIIISCGALLYAVMEWRDRRAIRRATFERGRE